MITAYLRDEQSIYTGSVSVDPMGPIPARSVLTVPPELTGAEVARWAGNKWEVLAERPAVPDAGPAIPQSVTPAQGLMALYELKAITEDDINAAIDSIEDPALRYQAMIAFKKATLWERASVSMQLVAGLMALTDQDLDKLFTLGATYTNL